ncbi:hypothetical protein [Mariprofundus erugo]|uniref:hypothetical protein n=1 Tax=Mariprofundus erugo TaxID=2528639 RepID=UPI001EE7E58E|nr:hypothetical protein [Mariprofundus erugo]
MHAFRKYDGVALDMAFIRRMLKFRAKRVKTDHPTAVALSLLLMIVRKNAMQRLAAKIVTQYLKGALHDTDSIKFF